MEFVLYFTWKESEATNIVSCTKKRIGHVDDKIDATE